MRTDSPIKIKDEDKLERYSFAEDIVKGLLKTFNTGQDSIRLA